MQRIAVLSSNVEGVGYDLATSTLEVAFHPDRTGCSRVYTYSPVDAGVYEQMIAPGESVGSHVSALARSAKAGAITCTRLGDVVPAGEGI